MHWNSGDRPRILWPSIYLIALPMLSGIDGRVSVSFVEKVSLFLEAVIL